MPLGKRNKMGISQALPGDQKSPAEVPAVHGRAGLGLRPLQVGHLVFTLQGRRLRDSQSQVTPTDSGAPP